jgi:hypothetical protein
MTALESMQDPGLHVRPEGGTSERRLEEEKREKKKKKEKEKKEKKGTEYSKAVETLFRSTYQTHVSLTAMADGKASIMLTINGLLFSVVLATITPRITKDDWLIWPVIIVLLTCVASLLFAVLAVRPRVYRGVVTLESLRSGQVNPLFFGNYSQVPEAAFRTAIAELLQHPERLYDVMSQDLYGMGAVLSRKYRLLQRSYDIFATGMILGMIAFSIVYVKMAA